MLDLNTIYKQVESIINQNIKKEHALQGHHLTGETDESLEGKISGTSLLGYATKYAEVLNKGLEPEQISNKMYPGLVQYFILRGFDEKEAKRIAWATLNKWKEEGMSTEASKVYSQTGERQHFIDNALNDPEVDFFMITALDRSINEYYNLTKSETV